MKTTQLSISSPQEHLPFVDHANTYLKLLMNVDIIPSFKEVHIIEYLHNNF
jgi:hypothetical protein